MRDQQFTELLQVRVEPELAFYLAQIARAGSRSKSSLIREYLWMQVRREDGEEALQGKEGDPVAAS